MAWLKLNEFRSVIKLGKLIGRENSRNVAEEVFVVKCFYKGYKNLMQMPNNIFCFLVQWICHQDLEPFGRVPQEEHPEGAEERSIAGRQGNLFLGATSLRQLVIWSRGWIETIEI